MGSECKLKSVRKIAAVLSVLCLLSGCAAEGQSSSTASDGETHWQATETTAPNGEQEAMSDSESSMQTTRGGTDSVIVNSVAYYRVTPEESDEVLINPGKGWILYDNGRGDFSQQTAETWAYGTLGYARLYWADVETADGVYDFSIIDKGIAQCKAHGKTYAFGIMACNPTGMSDYSTPKFILDRADVNVLTLAVPNYARPNASVPGGYEKMTKHVVDYTNPGEGYYKKLDELAQALANRYGNDPNIEYIDIRGFGSWGENSYGWLTGSTEDGPGFDNGICQDDKQDHGINTAVMKRCWQSYIKAFSGKRAKLMTAWGFGCNQCMNLIQKEAFYMAASLGVGIRRDGYSGYGACDCYEVLWGLNQVPTALEMDGSYQNQKKNNGFDAQRLLDSPLENRACYYPLGTYGTDGALMLRELKSAIDTVTNQIGYHFVLKEADISTNLGMNGEGTITMAWMNDGTAKLFMKSSVWVALLDENNHVVDTCRLEHIDPGDWTCALDLLTGDKTTRVTDTFRFTKYDPKKVSKYRLAVGVYSDKGTADPDILIGNTGRTEHNWYVIYTPGAAKPVTNLAVKTATASGSLNASTCAAAALTADNVTYWSGNADEQQWLQLDLEQVQPVQSLDLSWGRAYASAYTVEVSRDAAMWETVYTASAGKGGKEHLTFPTRQARYIRVRMTASATEAVSAVIPVAVTGRQLLVNGGFERGIYGWRDLNNASLCTVSGRVKSGSTSLAFQSGRAATAVCSLTHIFEETGPGQYRLTFDLYSANDKTTVQASIAVKGSGDDHTDLAWWAPRTTEVKRDTAVKGQWKTVTMDFNLSWKGLMEMAKLELLATVENGLDACVDNVTLVKTGAINGERQACVQRDEGRYTLLNVSVS